jgi:predicted NAD/FAD-binding protein
VSPILPDRLWPAFAGWNRPGLEAFATAFAAAKAREEADAGWGLTLGAWLPTLGLSRAQWEGMVLPWAASLYSGNVDETRGLSARAAMVFAAKALPDSPAENLEYFVLDGGMAEPLRRMVGQLATVEVLTGARVVDASRGLGGFLVRCADGRRRHVDDLVLASSGPAALRLLEGMPGTAAQRAALRGIEFRDARLMLHEDAAYAPAEPAFWSFLNCEARAGSCEASMWLAPVLTAPPGAAPPRLFKSWVTHREREPDQVIHEARFRHLLPTPASLLSQDRLRALQGEGGMWFAGGYTFPFDSQETALLSALRVASGLGVTSARGRALLRASGATGSSSPGRRRDGKRRAARA